MSDIASAMTMRDVAGQMAAAIEALTELTAHGAERASMDDVRGVIASLERMGQIAPHLCEQLARIVVVQREDRRLKTAPGQELDFWVSEVVEALASAGRAADMMAAALNQAGRTSAELRQALHEEPVGPLPGAPQQVDPVCRPQIVWPSAAVSAAAASLPPERGV